MILRQPKQVLDPLRSAWAAPAGVDVVSEFGYARKQLRSRLDCLRA